MFKLDRNFYQTYSYNENRKESDNYSHLSFEEKIQVFLYLQSVAYNYKMGSPPKMDKTIHSFRKLK